MPDWPFDLIALSIAAALGVAMLAVPRVGRRRPGVRRVLATGALAAGAALLLSFLLETT